MSRAGVVFVSTSATDSGGTEISTEASKTSDTNCGQAVKERRLEEYQDEQILQAFRNGEDSAFDRLVRNYRGQVYRVCFRFTGNHHDADDLAQEVFLRVYRGLPRFKGRSKLSTWLYRVAVNTCLNWVSARKNVTEPLPENLPDTAPGQVEQLSRHERSRTVRRALVQLPDKQRLTLILRTYHGLSHKEISEVMGSSVGTAKANFFFALRNLRKALEKAGLSTAE